MELRSNNGNIFTLKVERYEFPDEDLGPTDDNPADEDFDTGRFLVVSHQLGNADGKWNREFPTMDTDQFTRLIDWLNSIRHNRMTTEGVYFTERCLELTVDHASSSLLVHLFWDLLPPWIAEDGNVVLAFPLANIDLDAVISSLQDQSRRFPGRPSLPTGG